MDDNDLSINIGRIRLFRDRKGFFMEYYRVGILANPLSSKAYWMQLLLLLFTMSVFSHQGVAETLGSQCVTEQTCETENLPKWELGVGGIGLNGPDYPASDENHSRTLVIPYFIYRGDIISAGDGGLLKAKAFEDDHWELDLSLDAAFNSDSDKNNARKGMDDLDYLFGIGPELKYRIYQDSDKQQKLDVKFQFRAVFSTDFSNINQRGYVYENQLRYEHKQLFHDNLKFVGSLGPMWGSEKLMDYFYQVNTRDVLANRAEYDAQAGYMGSELNLGLVVSVFDKKGRIFLGTRTSFHQGAKNDDSPLYKEDTTFAVALGFSYRLFASDDKSKR